MKKLLLSSAAVCGLAMIATPAAAQVQLELGGYFKGYGAFVSQDDTSASEAKSFDMIRDTELHIGGETTLDNGLTVGAHIEITGDAESGDISPNESYAYFSGGWGRVNVGAEDGAGYLLQVAAPAADSNVDGIRQYVQPVNYTALGAAGFAPTQGNVDNGIDYDMDITSKDDKITYLSPIFSGFQVGASYTPDSDAASDLEGVGTTGDQTEEAYEIALRYEGQFDGVGVIAGAGYAEVEDDRNISTAEDRQAWNIGVDLDIGPFGVGAIYTEDNGGTTEDEETFVVGVDYTTGPFKIGASYFDQENSFAQTDEDTTRYSGGVTYTYGPGMTFRGSIGHIEHEDGTAADDTDATYVLLGTQVNF